jgi:hypothetical protein
VVLGEGAVSCGRGNPVQFGGLRGGFEQEVRTVGVEPAPGDEAGVHAKILRIIDAGSGLGLQGLLEIRVPHRS